MEKETKNWVSCLLAYARGSEGKLLGSVCLSVISVAAGLVPYYCVFRLIEACIYGTMTAESIVFWCLMALLAYAVKVVFSDCPPDCPTMRRIISWKSSGFGWRTAFSMPLSGR